MRVQIWAKQAKIGPKIRVVLPFSEVLFLVLLEITYDESLEQYLTSRGKTLETKWRRGYIIGPDDFCNFLNFASLIFLSIAQDCSLGQYLKSSRTENSKWKIYGPNGGWSDLFCSNVVVLSVKLACFFKNYAENETRRLRPLFVFLKKLYMR